jgi:uncharacterized membrane protein
MTRPAPLIQLTHGQRLLEWIIVVLSVALLAGTAWMYGRLPDTIPLHFNASGQVDRWSHKAHIWWLPGIYVGLALLLGWLNRYPQWFNYSVKVTETNAQQLYQMGARFLRWIRGWLAVIFCLVQFSIVDAAHRGGETPYLFLVGMGVAGMLLTTVWGVYRFHISAPK